MLRSKTALSMVWGGDGWCRTGWIGWCGTGWISCHDASVLVGVLAGAVVVVQLPCQLQLRLLQLSIQRSLLRSSDPADKTHICCCCRLRLRLVGHCGEVGWGEALRSMTASTHDMQFCQTVISKGLKGPTVISNACNPNRPSG